MVYKNTDRQALEEALSTTNTVKSSALLLLYATFSAADLNDEKAYWDSLNYASSLPAYKTVLRLLHSNNFAAIVHLSRWFLQYDFPTFLRCIVPDLVADVNLLFTFFKRKAQQNLLLFCAQIIQIRALSYGSSPSHRVSSGDALDIKGRYNIYKAQQSQDVLSFEDFRTMYIAINFYTLDRHELSVQIFSKKAANTVHQINHILSEELQMPRATQLHLITEAFIHDAQFDDFQKADQVFGFMQIRGLEQRGEHLYKSLRLIYKSSPLEVLCAASIYKRSPAAGKSKNVQQVEDLYIENDIPLENSLVFHHIPAYYGSTYDLAIFFPTPHFVRKWMSNADLSCKNTLFIFENEDVCKLLSFHYSRPDYAGDITNFKAQFISYNAWLAQIDRNQQMPNCCVVFANHVQSYVFDNWLQLVKDSGQSVDVLSLHSSYDFEHASFPFSNQPKDPAVQIETIELIPTGINNSLQPKRKMLFFAKINPSIPLSVSGTNILSYNLCNNKVNQLLYEQETPIIIDLPTLGTTIRERYRIEKEQLSAIRKSRNQALSYNYTPDLKIWYSASPISSNPDRLRVEAYICEPSTSGLRGKVCKETRKHTTRLKQNEITYWLENSYPFSTVQARRNHAEMTGSNVSELKDAYTIREQIIALYSDYWKGKNIALKTLWYIFQNLQDLYNPSDYHKLVEMMLSDIGQYRPTELSAQECAHVLFHLYPTETQDALWRRFCILERLLRQGTAYGYCTTNELYSAVHERNIRNKLFSQVRSALVKKHFTLEEMQSAYHLILDHIRNGETEYIGVLIRLMTGLESNIVAGLKWEDFRTVEDFGIYQFVITHQLTNDGKTVKGFASLHDYRCVPCCRSLEKILLAYRESMLTQAGSLHQLLLSPIVQPPLTTGRKYGSSITPRDLEIRCKSILQQLHLPDKLIEIPTKDNGSIETNLNRYSGNFFRENFRFWVSTYAKLSGDEVQYLLGNRPDTTFGQFYCDYLNDASQALLHVKLQRLDSLLTGLHACGENKQYEKIQHFQQTYVNSGKDPSRLLVKMEIEESPTTVTIHTASANGLTVQGSVLGK